jgi:hypothetical protein
MRRETRLKSIICAAIVLFGSGYARAGIWTTLDAPGAFGGATEVFGISGNNLVGKYEDDHGFFHGFIYNGTSWTTLQMPGGADVCPYGIDGSNVVGSHSFDGFRYNLDTQSWTIPPSVPGGSYGTNIYGIDGSNLVGNYYDWYDYSHGIFYNGNGTSWTILDKPGAEETYIQGIEGSKLVGDYHTSDGHIHGFLYDLNTKSWTTIDKEGAVFTYITGIDGSNLVGYYAESSNLDIFHGFLYNGTTWTILDAPGATYTKIYGIDGSNLVGYQYTPGVVHGFMYTTPEPATLLLLGLGAVILRKRKK